MSEGRANGRLEAFCDGIFAIAITLLVLDIHVPDAGSVGHAASLAARLVEEWPSWFSFLLTFLTLFIAWTNHHHALAQLDKTSSPFIYANGFLMLTVVVFPFSAALMGRYLDTGEAPLAIEIYCLTNLVHNLGWALLFRIARKPAPLARSETHHRRIEQTSRFVTIALATNAALLALAFWLPVVALVLVTCGWLFYLYAGIFVTSIAEG